MIYSTQTWFYKQFLCSGSEEAFRYKLKELSNGNIRYDVFSNTTEQEQRRAEANEGYFVRIIPLTLHGYYFCHKPPKLTNHSFVWYLSKPTVSFLLRHILRTDVSGISLLVLILARKGMRFQFSHNFGADLKGNTWRLFSHLQSMKIAV